MSFSSPSLNPHFSLNICKNIRLPLPHSLNKKEQTRSVNTVQMHFNPADYFREFDGEL